ncbi:MAG: tetratricopeptide repeat protein, partial [Planctomycetes bacterium]|nr:tetratricopeptide repeat protein [Planctomycetota bacterium]
WGKANPHLAAIAKIASDKLGLVAIRLTWHRESRRGEELRGLIMEAARELATNPRAADYACAEHLLQAAAAFHQGNERLEIAWLLRPVYERRREIAGAMAQWDRHVLNSLYAMGRHDEAFAKLREMAGHHAADPSIQREYAQALVQRGEVDAALKHLSSMETETACHILFQSYRLESLVAYVDEKMPQQDLTSQVLNQYLSALIMLDREDEAWKRIESWLDTDNRKRIEAAVQYAIGRGYNLYSYRRRLDDKHADMLARAVRRLSAHSTSVLYAGQILSSADFLSTDVGRALQKEFFDRLAKGTTTLPADEIQRLVGLVRHHYMPDEGEASWQRIFSEIAQRWEREAAEDQKTVLAAVISSYGPAELQIDYWRKVLASASTDAQRQQAAQMLFTLLMGGPWTRENEAELTRLLSPSSAFLQFATWLPSARAEATVQALPNVNEMPRRELKAAREQALKEARTAAIDLFRGLETQKELETIKPWIRVERLYLQAKIKQDLRSVHADAMAALREILKGGEEHRALALRLVATLMYVGTLEEAGREEVLSFLKEADGDVLDWKEMTYRFLIALDRGDELEAMLKEWTGDDFEKIRWGRDTAMILAERNRIDEAVALFEHIETVDELEHQDYRTLADWYMVQGRPDKRRVARIKSWQALSEYALSADLQREYGKVHRGGDSIPCELDEEIPFKFIALFRKSQDPRNCVWLLQQYYDSTRDFRLLECLPEAVLGQSAQRIYPFLAGLRAVTDKLQEEATLDRLSKHLAALHAQAESDVDRRALRLLEFAVERRACDQSHGAQPHVTAALRALKEAEGGTWADGEAEMMAGFLASQGPIVPAALAEEQLRQLRALHQGAAPGTEARLTIAGHAASALWSHGQKDAAVRILGPALDERRQANGGLLPVSANDPLSAYAGYREGMGEYATAEEVWLAELRSPRLAQQNLWLKEQLFAHYQRAYADQAEVSLGKGDALYAAAYARLLEELLRPSNEHHAHQLIQTLCGMWLARPSEPVRESSIEFAFKVLPRVLAMYQYRQGQESVSVVTQALEKIHGPKKVVAFLVDRAESEPRWLRLQNQGFWSRHGATLAHAIARAKPLDPALEERALAVVARELREDLRSGLRIHGGAYHDDHGDFWAEKKEEFARVAREVLAERPRSEGRITHVATYLYEGLSLASEAIDLLAGAHRDALLGLESTHLLTRYLQEQNRYAESVPILERLVAQRPDRLEFHIMLMRGHFHTGASERLQEVRKAADAYFHASGRWTEQVIATLGQACLETRLHAECADYLREAIALHVKTAPNRGVGDGQLAAYYRVAAGAYAGLGMTAKAVDAAAGAIVSWGRDIHQRAQDLARLEEVLEAAQDRDAYAAQLSAEAEKTGLENPIVRKALANVYLKRGEPAKAIEQARLAVANQPDDMETRRMLVQALDAAGKRQEATVELLAAVAVAGHDVAIPKELGDRWKNAGDPGEAERAYTNMVEVSAGESEGHEALARVRESEARWPEAEAQWHQVIRVRTNEPAGYVGLARVLIQMRKWDEARAIVDKLRTTSWPSRFGDVRSAANEIEELLKSRK